MSNLRDSARAPNIERYTPNQTAAVIRAVGITIDSDTGNDFLCFCPFHRNNYTPSLSISRSKGTFLCFNPSCASSGTLIELVMTLAKVNEFAAMRIILKKAGEAQPAFREDLEASMVTVPKFVEFSQQVIDNLKNEYCESIRAQQYMENRKFNQQTMDHFDVGYSAKKDMICVPMHDPTGIPIGIIGRSIEGKQFHNSVNLPKSRTMWNLHRARSLSSMVIVVEASFDAMRVHQAGYPNVVALLGGTLSKEQIHLFDKYFNKIVIMTDNDNKKFNDNCAKCRKKNFSLCVGHRPGLDLGQSIAGALHRKAIFWSSFKFGETYPHGAKDPGDMTDDEIQLCVKNAVPHFEFSSWSLT